MEIDLDFVLYLLKHAVKEADKWHDECRGGPIDDDSLIEQAKMLIYAYQNQEQDTPNPQAM